MKAFFLIFTTLCVQVRVFPQFRLSGEITGPAKPALLFLYKISGITRPAVLVARIPVQSAGAFHYVIKDAPAGEIFKLSGQTIPDEEDFPGKGLIFSATDTVGLTISCSGETELYSALILRSGFENKTFIQEFQNWTPFFSISEALRQDITEFKKDSLFHELLVWQADYLQNLQKTLSSTKRPSLICMLLYFLARFQLASGEGDFPKYYQLVAGMVPQSGLNNDFSKIAERFAGPSN